MNLVRFLWTEHWICIDKLSTIAMVFIRSNGNPRCCNLYSCYGLCCTFPCGMATLIPGVLNRTLSHIWLNWNLPIFLFRVGLFTLMKMDSLINLVKSCPSLPMMLKLSWVVWCPASWMYSCIGDGPLRFSWYVSPRVPDVSPIYSSPQSIAGHW